MTIPKRPKKFAVRLPALCVLAGVFCLWLSPPGAAQEDKKLRKDYALIYGTVWTPQDAPVAGVLVKIRRASDKKARWELVSDRNGEFAQRVPSGTMDYVIWAELKTHKQKMKAVTTAHIDNDERVDVGLHLTE